MEALDRNSITKSLSLTASKEFSHSDSKFSFFATIFLSMAKLVPANAAHPKGSLLILFRESANLSSSLENMASYAIK